jgi:hypothetical protein
VVESYARTWPRELIKLINSKRGRQDPSLAEAIALLAMPGVYVLYQGQDVYYIGKAANLRKRLRTHTRPGGRYSEHWTFINIYAIPNEAHMSAIESVLIASIPSANGARPRIKRIPLPARALRDSQQQK